MTFLYEDGVLAHLLNASGVFDQLTKQAQQAADETKLLAVKLTKQLMDQAVQQSGVNDTEIYVKDLTDLDAYLNFLVKNEQRYDGQLIAYHDAIGTSPPPNADKYSKYKEFYVLKDGLIDRLRELDRAANQPGNEVMKPLVKGLIGQANQNLKTNYEHEQPLPGERGSVGDKELPTERGGIGKRKQEYQVGFSADQKTIEDATDPNYQTVSNKSKNPNSKTNMQNDIMELRNAMPFPTNNSISPYNMYLFVSTILKVLQKNPQLIAGPMLGQYEQFSRDMYNDYNNWQQFVSRVASQNPASNAQSARDEVPFDRAQRPLTMLENLFGSTFNAREAAQRLLQMVNLTNQALLSLQRSPQFLDLLGKDIVSNQAAQAQAYNSSLAPYAH